ncbi:phosphatidylglycerol lysyltransferase domain-containing protein [Pleomorphomonas oryzae]|uniref:phosphatidylglycerol lysyltransferase domain-containing protein n=1 Tax=Pleomorphomonas oryzae TaxID=261934 RepID=UPI0003FCBF89|nr:phosphatidylglycerol lysyltransferase domain-containing protein [Pleomorphomonas oryzae]
MRTTEATEMVPTAFSFTCNRLVIFAVLAFAVVTLSLIAPGRLMRAKRGRSWISLLDPMGDPAARAEWIWRIVGFVRAHGGGAVFYQVAARKLSRYVDLGLSVFKLGEEAIVDLSVFDIKGSRRSNMRDGLNPLLALADVIFVIGGGLRGVVAE